MVGSNKILTVSYGTFSCTLEGFDDSFHSMKAIAEYFRDLAQEDRYFGAEPPTPDAEMLARIAEREISRRVEAEMDDRGIRLRATAPQVAAPAVDDAAPIAEPELTDADKEADAPVAMPPAVDAPAADQSIASAFAGTPAAEIAPAPTAAPAAAAPVPGSFAAKLQRIRAVVSTPIEADVSAPEEETPSPLMDLDAGTEEELLTNDLTVETDLADDVLSQDPEDIVAEPAPTEEAIEEEVAETKDTFAAEDLAEAAEEESNVDAAEAEVHVEAVEADTAEAAEVEAVAEDDASTDEVEAEAQDDAEAVEADTADDAEVEAAAEDDAGTDEVEAEAEVDAEADTEDDADDAEVEATAEDDAGTDEVEAEAQDDAEAVEADTADDAEAAEVEATAEDDADTDEVEAEAEDDAEADTEDDADAAEVETVAEDDAGTDEVEAEAEEDAVEAAVEDAAVAQADVDQDDTLSAVMDAISDQADHADAEPVADDTAAAFDSDAADEPAVAGADDTADADFAAWAAGSLSQTEEPTDADELEAEAADADADMSFDLNDNDLPAPEPEATPAPTPSRPMSKARIVRIRKNDRASSEVIAVDGDETSQLDSMVEEGFVEKAPADEIDADIAADVAAVAASIAARQAEEAEETDAIGTSEDVDAFVADAVDDDLPEVAENPVQDSTADSGHDNILAAIAAAMPAGSLSDEDEEDLQRELAAVSEEVVTLDEDVAEPQEIVIDDVPENEVLEEAAADDVADPIDTVDASEDAPAAELTEDAGETDDETEEGPAPLPEVKQAEARTKRRLPDADYAVTRMIAQTDEALNEPAGSRRRNAIAQLKAAVAATEAARQLGDDANGSGDSENAFREDLDEVVRSSRPIESSRPIQPSRPVEADQQTARAPAAPLKLVASQRVDGEEQAAQKRPISDSISAKDIGGFAQFAASMGATELPDLLEAAAAYTSFVEGVEDFSRPQIMKKVQMTTTEEFSREDGLRSFGTLLRQGRISKVRNGRFQISEQTRFRPDQRSA